MKPYIVSLFGHRDLHTHRKVEERLTEILRELIMSKEYVEVYIGRNGEFDRFAASVIKSVIKNFSYGNIGMTLVLPYPDKDMEYYEVYYDSITIPECVAGTHPKGAITKRNKWMVVESDLVICYVERESGGAYSAIKYAKKLKKRVVNIGISDDIENEENSLSF